LGLAILRFLLVCHSLALLAESVFAGQFLSGSDSSVKFHEINGQAIGVICVLQIIAVAALMRSRTASLWLLLGSVFLLLGEGLQIGTGYGRFLNVHIPLGVILFAVVTWQAISVFLKSK
jgi:hypothetical protein